MAYDPVLDRIVMFGGLTESGVTNDTWVFDPTNRTWGLISTAQSPPARMGHAVVYDPASRLVVLFGGTNFARWPDDRLFSDTWVFDLAAREWTKRYPVSSPSARSGNGMVYEPGSRRIVLFGGMRNNETWTYETGGNVWTRIAPRTSPPGNMSAVQMAYNAATRKIVLVQWGASSEEAWIYDPALLTWTKAARRPPFYPRFDGSLVDDSADGRLLLFGGDAGVHYDAETTPGLLEHYNETWRYDVALDAWESLRPTGDIGKRAGHAMVYHPPSAKTILFGGKLDYCPVFNDEMWSYDSRATAWTKTSHGSLPSAPYALFALGTNRSNTLWWRPPRENGGGTILGYTVYWAPTEPEPPGSIASWATIRISNVTALAHWGLLNGLTYVYFVSASTDRGEGPLSCFAFGIPGGRPGPPRHMTLQARDRQILLRWDQPADGEYFYGLRYNVYRGLSSDMLTLLDTTANTTYLDTNVTNGVMYYYYAVAQLRQWWPPTIFESPPSDLVAGTPTPAPWSILIGLGGLGTGAAMAVLVLLRWRTRRRRGGTRKSV